MERGLPPIRSASSASSSSMQPRPPSGGRRRTAQPPSQQRGRSASRERDANAVRVAADAADGDVQALAAEVEALEQQLMLAERQTASAGGTGRGGATTSAPRLVAARPSPLEGRPAWNANQQQQRGAVERPSSAAGSGSSGSSMSTSPPPDFNKEQVQPQVTAVGHDLRSTFAMARTLGADTLAALEDAANNQNGLNSKVTYLEDKLMQHTHAELDVVNQLALLQEENADLKSRFSSAAKELELQHALMHREISVVEELSRVTGQRDKAIEDLEVKKQIARPTEQALLVERQTVRALEAKVAASATETQKLRKGTADLTVELRRTESTMGQQLDAALQAAIAAEAKAAGSHADFEAADGAMRQQDAAFQEAMLEVARLESLYALTVQKRDEMSQKKSDEIAAQKQATVDTETRMQGDVNKAYGDRTLVVKELRRLQEKATELTESLKTREAEAQVATELKDAAETEMRAATEREETALEQRRLALLEANSVRIQAEEGLERLAVGEAERIRLDAEAAVLKRQRDEEYAENESRMTQAVEDVRIANETREREVSLAEAAKALAEVQLSEARADAQVLADTIEAVRQDSARAWEELQAKHELAIEEERERAQERTDDALDEQRRALDKSWGDKVAEQKELKEKFRAAEEEAIATLALREDRIRELEAELEARSEELRDTHEQLREAMREIERLNSAMAEAMAQMRAKDAEMREKQAQLDETLGAKKELEIEVGTLQATKSKLSEEMSYMENKLVSARTDKLDSIADSQVGNVLLQKELAVRQDQQERERAENLKVAADLERVKSRLEEAARTIDFLRADVRRLDEERAALRISHRNALQRVEAERDAYEKEVERLGFFITESNAQSEEVLVRASVEQQSLQEKLAAARGLFNTIFTRLSDPVLEGSAAPDGVQMMQGTSGALVVGQDRESQLSVSVDFRGLDASQRMGASGRSAFAEDDLEGDDLADDLDETPPTRVPLTEELTEAVSMSTWNRRKERRQQQKEELQRLRMKLAESENERDVLNRALRDLTRNLAAMRFTEMDQEKAKALADDKPLYIRPAAQAVDGIEAPSAAGSRRAASRATSSFSVAFIPRESRASSRGSSRASSFAGSRAGSRALSVASLAAMPASTQEITAAPHGNPAATEFGFGPSLPAPPPDGAVEDGPAPPTLDEIFDYARYLGLDLAMDHDLLWIAEEALCAPLPQGWTEHTDSEDNIYFHNQASDVSSYEHPMDQDYKNIVNRVKNERLTLSMEELRSEVLGLKQQGFMSSQLQAAGLGTLDTGAGDED